MPTTRALRINTSSPTTVSLEDTDPLYFPPQPNGAVVSACDDGFCASFLDASETPESSTNSAARSSPAASFPSGTDISSARQGYSRYARSLTARALSRPARRRASTWPYRQSDLNVIAMKRPTRGATLRGVSKPERKDRPRRRATALAPQRGLTRATPTWARTYSDGWPLGAHGPPGPTPRTSSRRRATSAAEPPGSGRSAACGRARLTPLTASNSWDVGANCVYLGLAHRTAGTAIAIVRPARSTRAAGRWYEAPFVRLVNATS